MSTDGASSPSRLLPRLLGVLLLIMGLALLAGGIKLSMLGGSLYYLLAGIGITLTGLLLLATRRAALGLYALVLFASTVWALWEVGLDWWQLVPRLALLFALGIVMLLPWFRRPLLRGQPAPLGTGALSVAVVLAGAAAVASQFTHPGEIKGQLDRDAVPGMASAAPSQADGDWNSYGRSAYGDRLAMKARQPPNSVMSRASARAQGSQIKPLTLRPSASNRLPMPSGAGISATNSPKRAIGMSHSSTMIARPLSALASPGLGGTVPGNA